MDYMIYLIYSVLIFLLLWQAHRIPEEERRKEGLPGKERTKPLLGFNAVCILLHHLSQKTSASWLPAAVRKQGLEPFVNAGYLCVSYFFFVSGFGLWKSCREKEGYLDSFPVKRIYPLILTFAYSEFFFILARLQWDRPAFPENGYSWYVFTILLFYILFFVIMRFCPKAFLPMMGLSVALYCVICYSLVAGEWLYNSVPAFMAGLLAGKYEKKLASALQHRPVMILLLIMTVFTAAAANHTELISLIFGQGVAFGTVKNTQLALQMTASVLFPLLMTVLLMCVKIGNRALNFLGSLTLELYLIQGLFVDIFSYCFIRESNPPVFYIHNAGLYCIVVIALSVPSAWLLQKACDFSKDRIRRSGFTQMVWKDTKVLFQVLVCIGVAVTLFMSVRTRITAGKMEDEIADYRENNLTCVSAGDTEAVISVSGGGENTVVFLGDESVPCTTLIYEELTGLLSSSCTVMTVDRPGSGFSGDTKEARTAENIAKELHEMLHQTNADFPLVIMANGNAGLFALEYSALYPEDVKAFIGLDAYVPVLGDYEQGASGYSPDEYAWRLKRTENRNSAGKRMLHFFGFDRWGLTFLDILNHGKHYPPNRDILDELYLTGQVSRATANERKEYYENTRRLSGVQFPDNIPCLFLIHYSLTDPSREKTDMNTMTQSVISNEKIQYTVLMAGNPYSVLTEPAGIAEQAGLFIEELP